jgi:mRNA interferase RelE/StbE
MAFALLYHPDVVRADLVPIPLNVRERIAAALARRLQEAPERFGHPLRGTLKGYWKLRVGDYRVVYRIVGAEVWILAILHRRQVYEDVLRRIGWEPAHGGT